jgi:hypothetical protein
MFSEPGTYVRSALAHDGGLIDLEDVTVVVEPKQGRSGPGPRSPPHSSAQR